MALNHTEMSRSAIPRVVIVGAGFAGLSAARALAGAAVDITLIDKRNHHLFQPLLYQVATAGLTPSDIAWPVRGIFSRQANVHVVLGKVCAVDKATRTVVTEDGRKLEYDWLIIATGAKHNYFGNESWCPVAPGLKCVEDATLIRRRILLAFERAEIATEPEERARQMSFVIVGGGPTGVEMAGAIAELASHALAKDFKVIDPRSTRIILIEGGKRVLAAFPESLSTYAAKALKRLGVEVQTNKRVTHCDKTGVTADSEHIPAGTIIWAAGVAASPAAKWLATKADTKGRAIVNPDLTLPGQPEVFILGDTASINNADGTQVPGIAPAAKQAGQYAARVIRAALEGKSRPAPFRYRHNGNLATIGRHLAVINFGRFQLKGWVAWWVWGLAHIYFLVGARNRLMVALQWFFSYLTFGRGARLITGTKNEIRPD